MQVNQKIASSKILLPDNKMNSLGIYKTDSKEQLRTLFAELDLNKIFT